MRAQHYTESRRNDAERAPMPSPPIYNSRGVPAWEPMTFEEFLEWCDEDIRAEWVNGKVELMSPVNIPHQQTVVWILRVLSDFVERRGLGAVLCGPAGIRLRTIASFREPDVFFVASAREGQIAHQFVDGPPDLVVEVISPSNHSHDRVTKFQEYAKAGVTEYWLIDPENTEAEFHVLGRNHQYRLSPVGDDGIYRSHVIPGFFLHTTWLWARPPLAGVLKEFGLT